jgi:hypothetical protein
MAPDSGTEPVLGLSIHTKCEYFMAMLGDPSCALVMAGGLESWQEVSTGREAVR